MNERFWAWGVYATLIMTLLIPLSIRPVRVRCYETFLNLHIVLSVGVLVLLYVHVERFGYLPWVWICVGLWVRSLQSGLIPD